MNTEHDAKLGEVDLEELVTKIRSVLTIKDRRHGLRRTTYKKCFVGKEAVQAFVKEGIAVDEQDALNIGNMLLEVGAFHHVLREHTFKNENLFYRFASDEDHGKVSTKVDGSSVSWSDFLPQVSASSSDSESLQPKIPEKDLELAEFEQDDLDTVGVSPLDEHNVKLLDNVHPKKWVDPKPKANYNLVVIGAGAGGLVSSAGAAGVGAHVALIESHLLGGDCLNVGCVPSKALIRCAKAAAGVREAGEYGVKISGEIHVDFQCRYGTDASFTS